MTRSTSQWIATLGLAAVAVTAIGGAVSGAADEATTCQIWRPRITVSDRSQHTWNPDSNDGGYQHTWNPDSNDGGYQHTLNPAGDRSDACLPPSPTLP